MGEMDAQVDSKNPFVEMVDTITKVFINYGMLIVQLEKRISDLEKKLS